MEVINEEEQEILNYIRTHTKRPPNLIPKVATNVSKLMLSKGSNCNNPAYND